MDFPSFLKGVAAFAEKLRLEAGEPLLGAADGPGAQGGGGGSGDGGGGDGPAYGEGSKGESFEISFDRASTDDEKW